MPPKEEPVLSSQKLELNAFLKMLTVAGLSMPDAMAIASKLFKTHNSPQALAELSDAKLTDLKVDKKEHRRLILNALKTAGYKSSAKKVPQPISVASSSLAKKQTNPRKRNRTNDFDAPLAGPSNELPVNLDFREVLDEEVLKSKAVVINRAPIMTAWAMVVAERLAFEREEALSIASVYTEMNAISKGVSLGIFEKSKDQGLELGPSSAQPYVELMGRNPLMTTKSKQWRALLKGEPSEPLSAFSYISRSLAQTAPYIIGALRLLSNSFSDPQELNKNGYGIYCQFRPNVEKWGGKGKMTATTILALRKPASPAVNVDADDDRLSKKPRLEKKEEFKGEDIAELEPIE